MRTTINSQEFTSRSPTGKFLTIITKFVIIINRLPKGQKKRFYFNVLKREKKRIIKIAKKWKKVYIHERAVVHVK